MHCNLRPSDATPVLFCFNYDAMTSLKSMLEYSSVFAADTLLYAVTLTFNPVTFDL